MAWKRGFYLYLSYGGVLLTSSIKPGQVLVCLAPELVPGEGLMNMIVLRLGGYFSRSCNISHGFLCPAKELLQFLCSLVIQQMGGRHQSFEMYWLLIGCIVCKHGCIKQYIGS